MNKNNKGERKDYLSTIVKKEHLDKISKDKRKMIKTTAIKSKDIFIKLAKE